MKQVTNKMDFEALLMPYVQGNLDEATCKQIEKHAASDEAFNKKLNFELRLKDTIKQSAENFVEISPSFQKLRERIESEPKQRKIRRLFTAGQGINFSWFNPGIAFASIVMISLGVYILFSHQPNHQLVENYETLSNPDQTLVYQKDKQYLRIVTNEEQHQLAQLKQQYGFVIESGPDSLNSYVISLITNKPLSNEQLKNWRADHRFKLVEPLEIQNDYY